MTKIIDMTRSARLCFAVIASLLIVCPLYVQAQQCDLQSGQQPEVYLADGLTQITDNNLPALVNRLPVLFVHGHNLNSASDADQNFQKNWFNAPSGLTSFKDTIESNSSLGIEPYYIRFQDQGRSIVADACDIALAIELILQRHDPDYVPLDLTSNTHVQVVLIGYSKGAISSRLYLKSLIEPVNNLPVPRPGLRPVSEFIAIAAPNHGLKPNSVILALFGSSLATKQLYNGYGPPSLLPVNLQGDRECESFNEPEATNFIAILNGHDMADSHDDALPLGDYESEAPGSRADGTKPTEGVLYVNIYDDGDFVGGDTPPSGINVDCHLTDDNGFKQGRKLAENLAPDAVKKTVDIAGANATAVHQNTVHDPVTICLALYAAAHHKAPPGPNPCNVSAGQVPVIPPPPRASAMLALDFSGSMRLTACADSICGNAKHLVLRQAVELFVQLWRAVGAPTDHLGVTYFGTQVDEVDFSGDRLVPLLELVGSMDYGQLIIDNVNNRTDPSFTELTAMGGALLSSIDSLNQFSVSQSEGLRVILFTDGMQNVPPLVSTVPQNCSGISCDYALDGSPLDTNLGIQIDTIGVGSGDTFTELLAGIAADTNGHADTTIAPDNDLREFFILKLINALRGFSPQLVAYRRGTLNNDETTENFTVNRSARRVVFKVSWPVDPHGREGEVEAWRIEKDGIDVTQSGQITAGPFYRIFSLDVPTGAIEAQGEWRVHFSGTPGLAYEAAAIVDETRLKYELSLGPGGQIAGHPLDLQLQMSLDGKPLTTDAQINATLLAPGESLGTLLSTTPMPTEPPGLQLEPQITNGQRKMQWLLQDPAFLEKLRPVRKGITLTHQGNGLYSAATEAVTVPGMYRVLFQIKGEHPEIGTFVRTDSMATHVGFGIADLPTSAVHVEPVGTSDSGRKLRLQLQPRDQFGNYLGPDYGDRILITLTEGTVGKEIQDTGDGIYYTEIQIPEGSDPDITITVRGESLFSGPVSELTPKKEGISLLWWLVLLFVIVVILLLWRRL